MSEPYDAAPDLPARIALRPGVEVLRRDDRHLQFWHPAGGAVLPDSDGLRGLLTRLRAGRARLPEEPELREAARVLLAAGLLVDGGRFWADLSAHPGAAPAAYAEDPVTASGRLGRRVSTRVGLEVHPAWEAELTRLLAAAGVALATGAATPDLVLLGVRGEPSRDRIDELARAGRAHLLLRCRGGRVTLGPLVVPGRTACVRCEDAHHRERDPRWPLLVAQLPSALTPRTTAEPADPSLLALGLAWLARDAVTFLDGGRPATWSTTVELDPTLELSRRRWLRHPHCGCAWAEPVAAQGA